MHRKSTLHCIAFCHFPTVTLIRRCLDPSFAFLDSHSPHDPVQALASSGPMLFHVKPKLVRVALCFRTSARAWHETNDLRNTMKQTAHRYCKVAKCVHGPRLRLYFKLANTTTYWQETILFWTHCFWTLGIWVSLKNISKYIQKRVQV